MLIGSHVTSEWAVFHDAETIIVSRQINIIYLIALDLVDSAKLLVSVAILRDSVPRLLKLSRDFLAVNRLAKGRVNLRDDTARRVDCISFQTSLITELMISINSSMMI